MGDATDMGKKTGIELLREYARSGKPHNCDFLQKASGRQCAHVASCEQCVSYAFTAIADQIERETFPRPRFENGKIACIGDEYEDKQGETHQILGFFFDNCDFTPVCIGIPREYSHGERLKRPYHDTQERIDDDAAMECRDYINACGLTWPEGASLGDIETLKCRDLLRRQRELCEREGGAR